MSQAESAASPLGSDRPVVDPTQDAFGYAPFARRIARAVSETPSPEGLVMAIHGPWGSGKSTLLNFVKHEIAAVPRAQQPVVIDFNPWWFTPDFVIPSRTSARAFPRSPNWASIWLPSPNVIMFCPVASILMPWNFGMVNSPGPSILSMPAAVI
jgi:hypothetical protein